MTVNHGGVGSTPIRSDFSFLKIMLSGGIKIFNVIMQPLRTQFILLKYVLNNLS